jgi:hypothetical protein
MVDFQVFMFVVRIMLYSLHPLKEFVLGVQERKKRVVIEYQNALCSWLGGCFMGWRERDIF